MANAKNILVGAARVLVSNGSGAARPNLTAANFPYSIADGVGTTVGSASSTSVYTYLNTGGVASAYWRDIGYTSNGVEISYEPGYSDVMVDQLLDAARLFKQSVKVTLRTEFDEGTLENIHVIFGQAEQFLNSSGQVTDALTNASAVTGASAQHLNIAAGAIGDAPVERSIVLIGNAPAFIGETFATPIVSGSGNATAGVSYSSAGTIKKERVYVARRAVQTETVTHSLKRDGATVYPVSFRCLPEDGSGYSYSGGATNGSEYGIILDRVYS
jgi:hypothetical protein